MNNARIIRLTCNFSKLFNVGLEILVSCLLADIVDKNLPSLLLPFLLLGLECHCPGHFFTSPTPAQVEIEVEGATRDREARDIYKRKRRYICLDCITCAMTLLTHGMAFRHFLSYWICNLDNNWSFFGFGSLNNFEILHIRISGFEHRRR